MCTDTVISLHRGRFYARYAKFSSLYREYRYIEDRYIGVLSHTFYCNFCRDIAYSSLYLGYRYIEDRYIGVPLYLGQSLEKQIRIKNQFLSGKLMCTDSRCTLHSKYVIIKVFFFLFLSFIVISVRTCSHAVLLECHIRY